jgi:hypothetical protein
MGSPRVRALVLNHTYKQDLDSLRRAAPDDFEIRVVELDLVLTETLRVLPDDIDESVPAYSRPEYEPHRQRLAEVVQQLMEDLFREEEFDVFVTPSDVFYYLRPAPQALHRLGVPYFVSERETTVAPHVMAENIDVIKQWFPPIADHRTLCSERLKSFWVGAGAPDEAVTVTGQPRFDYYRQPERWPKELPYGDSSDRTVLFLSYNYSAYHLDGTADKDVWKQQHMETEQGLWELARRGWRVLFKPHPHQERSDSKRLKQELGALFGERVHFINSDADTRELIVSADVVVGFQTTALFEAMAARKPIVYAAWREDTWVQPELLLPFREWPDVVDIVRRQEDFVETVERIYGREWDEARTAAAEKPITENIGLTDGHASERTLAKIRAVAERFEAARTPAMNELRASLSKRPPPLRLRRRTVYGYKRLRRRAGALLGR